TCATCRRRSCWKGGTRSSGRWACSTNCPAIRARLGQTGSQRRESEGNRLGAACRLRREMMGTMVLEQSVRIPGWVKDLDSFRRWSRSGEFPEHGRLSHLAGELWLDLSMERAAHNKIKGILGEEVGRLVREQELGHFFHDGM